MSYEPQILIKKSDLDESRRQIISDLYRDETNKALEFLEKLLNQTPSTISGIDFILCHPELTSFNQQFRNLLEHYYIEYCTFN